MRRIDFLLLCANPTEELQRRLTHEHIRPYITSSVEEGIEWLQRIPFAIVGIDQTLPQEVSVALEILAKQANENIRLQRLDLSDLTAVRKSLIAQAREIEGGKDEGREYTFTEQTLLPEIPVL